MIKESNRLNHIFGYLYEVSPFLRKKEDSFYEAMKSNKSRLDTINEFFELLQTGDLTRDERAVFDESIDYLYNFFNDNIKDEIPIPSEYYRGSEPNDSLIPSEKELNTLLSLIEENVKLYKRYYQDKEMIIFLPDNTFNMNMGRILSIEYHNLPHLLGLTEHEETPGKESNKNNLLKYYIDHVPNKEKYGNGMAEGLLNWIISPEGKQEIMRFHQLMMDFMQKDKIKNSGSYDKKGKLKENSYNGFIQRLNEEYKSLDIRFPIIKYARWLVKSINTLNFFNMENLNQIILDYNSETIVDKDGNEKKKNKSEKDIYLVSTSQDRLNKLTKKYLKRLHFLENVISVCNKDERIINALSEKLKSMDISKTEIDNFINLIINKSYYDENNISVDKEMSKIMEKINSYFAHKYNHEIHFIGFGTNYTKNPDGSTKIYELSDSMVNDAHCDTSISLDVVTLISEYYKRGRAFFIDKVESSDGSYLRISNPIEELEYYSQMKRLGIPVKDDEKALLKSFKKFNDNYMAYRYTDDFIKSKRKKQ